MKLIPRTAARTVRLSLLSLGLLSSFLIPSKAFAAFGFTSSGGNYVVDTGAGLVFKINQSSGDMVSMVYSGKELQSQNPYSHIDSGFGTATVSAQTIGSCVKVTVSTSSITHYYLARSGFNNIYMSTYTNGSTGELRYIARLSTSTLPNAPTASDIRNNTGTIESGDIFSLSNGQTRSKYYGRDRALELDATLTGATGSGVGVFMIHGNRERSSGGPFFRDIQQQTGSQNEVYNYMFSGHNQTESARGGLNGPYALVVTSGSAPSASSVDFTWINSAGLSLQGYVFTSGRGTITLNGISGMDTSYPYVVHYYNGNAQYWVTASSTGSCTKTGIIAGTYNMKIYKRELAVYSTTGVTVNAGSTTTLSSKTVTDPANTATIWRIGRWDGTPNEFLNAGNLINMHPSDVRMSDWGPVTYTVGSSSASQFPAVQWNAGAINDPTTIKFNLTSSQVTSHTVRVAITGAYEGGRPELAIGSYKSSPAASSQPDSRSFTTGTYRGNNTVYTFNVPASAFVSGTNTMTLNVISGSGASNYLSAAFAYDVVELQ